MEQNTESTNPNLPREDTIPPPSKTEESQDSTSTEQLEALDLIREAQDHEKLRVVKRKTRFFDILSLCLNALTILTAILLAWTAVTYFIHYLTPADWLEPNQVEFINDASKYIAIGAAFFAFGRKFSTIANIIESLGDLEDTLSN